MQLLLRHSTKTRQEFQVEAYKEEKSLRLVFLIYLYNEDQLKCTDWKRLGRRKENIF